MAQVAAIASSSGAKGGGGVRFRGGGRFWGLDLGAFYNRWENFREGVTFWQRTFLCER